MNLPSSHRPIPLAGRSDLVAQDAVYGGRECVVVKDPLSLDYYQLAPLQYRILQLLDGRISLQQLVQRLHAEGFGLEVDVATVQHQIFDLCEKHLLWNRRPQSPVESSNDPGRSAITWPQRIFSSLLFIRLPAWNATPLLHFLYPRFRWMFSPVTVLLAALGIMFSWGMLFSHFDEFQGRLPSLENVLTYREVFLLWISIGAAKLIHEFGHGLTCIHFGSRCHGIGVAFLLFSPCLYCDVSDSWMLSSKRQRILIALAGIWVELILSAICLGVWWNTAPGLIHDLCLQMFLVTSVSTVLFNTNPLLKYDGYYILCDLIEVPNLQQQGQREVQQFLRYLLLGIRATTEATTAHLARGWILFYGLSSTLYRWSMVLGIGLFLHALLKPTGLQSFSWCYAAASLLAAVSLFVTTLWKAITSPGWSQFMWMRSCAVWSVIGLVGVGIWHCPVPHRFSSPLFVEPFQIQHVYVDSPGMLEELAVSPGDQIHASQPLAQLTNPQLHQHVIETESRHRQAAIELKYAQATSDPDVGLLARQSLHTAQLRNEEAHEQRQRLTLKAPCAGRIISVAETHLGNGSLSNQYAGDLSTPLNPRNLGVPLGRESHVCSIAPSENWQAVAFVKAEECQYLDEQAEVDIRLDAFPGQQLTGKIERIAPSDDGLVPESLSTKHGGQLATITSPQGEVSSETLYQVTLLLAPNDLPLSTGLKGRGRFARPHETAGDWFIRSYYRLFEFH